MTDEAKRGEEKIRKMRKYEGEKERHLKRKIEQEKSRKKKNEKKIARYSV